MVSTSRTMTSFSPIMVELWSNLLAGVGVRSERAANHLQTRGLPFDDRHALDDRYDDSESLSPGSNPGPAAVETLTCR